jgi:hypothetical protein
MTRYFGCKKWRGYVVVGRCRPPFRCRFDRAYIARHPCDDYPSIVGPCALNVSLGVVAFGCEWMPPVRLEWAA